MSPIETLKTGLARSLFGSSGGVGGNIYGKKFQTAFYLKSSKMMVLRFFGHDFLKPLALSYLYKRSFRFTDGFLQGMPTLLWCTADLAQCLDWRPGMFQSSVTFFRGIWRTKKRDVFWILKIYVKYKIKRRFNKNGCVVFQCVFLLDMSFFSRCENGCFFVPGAEEESVPPPRTACS